ncbi:Ca2+-dependent phosphoinositide-specific phospholipase C [Myroides odoratus]|uniref:Ca2+-dependent phosphoinositide-specific phospholipase C n=1 Tax=Myroides odoratus TaxID=256 RepID=UPI0039AFC662
MKQLIFALLFGGCLTSYGQNIPLHKIQVIGSHNSYKKAIDKNLYQHLLEKNPDIQTLYYEHPSIETQLNLGLRNLEIDIWKDPEGNKYAHPTGAALTGKPYEWTKEMAQPGYKIFHMPNIDFETHQPLFIQQLQALKKWSEENPQHETIFITLELKDEEKDASSKYTKQDIQEINQILAQELTSKHLITPKELKRSPTFIQWPTIDEARGKFVWIIDNTDYRLTLFDTIELEDLAFFLNVPFAHPKAGCMILNNPYDPQIPRYANQGVIIRTRADDSTKQARSNDYSTFEQAKKSKAQIITTDYYIPSQLFPSTYRVIFADHTYVRIQD